MRHHTGDDASHVKGVFKCQFCDNTIRMKGNYGDHFPPCPYCKEGVDFEPVLLKNKKL